MITTYVEGATGNREKQGLCIYGCERRVECLAEDTHGFLCCMKGLMEIDQALEGE